MQLQTSLFHNTISISFLTCVYVFCTTPGNIIVGYSDKRSVIDALMQDLKEGGIAKNWNERGKTKQLRATSRVMTYFSGDEQLNYEP